MATEARAARPVAMLVALLALLFMASGPARAERWVASWTGAVQGPYPIGHAFAQPDLRFAFPVPEQGATDQSFRMIVRPDVWGQTARIHLSNLFGTKAVTFDGVFAGLQETGSAIVVGTNRPVLFNGAGSIKVEPGTAIVSDPVTLPFVTRPSDPLLRGRKLAISFHVIGESGPMTWHASAMTTSYIGPPAAGSTGADESGAALPYSTTSWFFVSEVDMQVADDTQVIVAFGDSITDGITTTLNGDDRWSDILSRRLRTRFGDAFAVVNQGIVGNQILDRPQSWPPQSWLWRANPLPGGPSALARLERDVIGVPAVTTVIWLEGINDFGDGNASVEAVAGAIDKGVGILRKGLPGVRVLVATLPPALNSPIGGHGSPSTDAKRRALNGLLRSSKAFDGVIDFEAAVLEAKTGELKPRMQPNSATGGAGDKLHPNRAGYMAMGAAIDLDLFKPRPR